MVDPPAPATPLTPPLSLVPSSIVYALLFAAVGVWTPYASVYFQSLGIGLAEIGLLVATISMVAIVMAPAWGLVADRLGDVRPPLLAAGLWAAAAALALAAGPSFPLLIVCVAWLASGAAALAPLVDARTVQRLGSERERFGQARAWGSIAFIVAAIVMGAIVDATSPRAMLLVYAPLLAATGIVGALILGRARRPVRVTSVSPMDAVRLLRQPPLGLFFAGSVVVWTAAAGVTTFLSLRLVQLGADAQLVGIGWAVNAVVEVPLMFAFRPLAKRVGIERLLVAGALLFALRSAGWALAGSAVAAVLVAGTGGFGFALFLVGTTAYVASRAPASRQATAQGLFSGTAYAIGSILGAVLGGQIAGAYGLAAIYPVGAAASCLGAVVVWLAVRPAHHPTAQATADPAAA